MTWYRLPKSGVLYHTDGPAPEGAEVVSEPEDLIAQAVADLEVTFEVRGSRREDGLTADEVEAEAADTDDQED